MDWGALARRDLALADKENCSVVVAGSRIA
jgi:hypothetical protein